MKRLLTGVFIGICLLTGSYYATPSAKADGCSAVRVPTTRWSNCDYDYQPDGSHTHCDTVFVFGFGGMNCFQVYPPAPE